MYRWVRLGLAYLEFYDPNLIRPASKKNFVTQPNPPSPKNLPNRWIGLGRVGFGRLTAHPYLIQT